MACTPKKILTLRSGTRKHKESRRQKVVSFLEESGVRIVSSSLRCIITEGDIKNLPHDIQKEIQWIR